MSCRPVNGQKLAQTGRRFRVRVSEIKGRGDERAQGLMGKMAFRSVRQKLPVLSCRASAGEQHQTRDRDFILLLYIPRCLERKS